MKIKHLISQRKFGWSNLSWLIFLLPQISISHETDGPHSTVALANTTSNNFADLANERSLLRSIGINLESLHSENSCEDCLLFNHSYDPKLAVLVVNFYCKNYSDPCCNPCSIGDISLFSYYRSENKTSCLELLHSQVLPDVEKFREVKINQSGEVTFPNTATGCYTLRLRSDCKPIPLYHGFFWVHTDTQIININQWNTIFFLNPNYKKGTLEVNWQAPLEPHEFTKFGLQLWHQKDMKINCRGEDAFGKHIEVIPKIGNIILKKPSYIFSNLTYGWYCVRVTPLDDRCGHLGCQPRASPVMFFQDMRSIREELIDKAWQFNPLWLLVPCGLIIAAVVTLSLQRRSRRAHIHKGNKYTIVSNILQTQECLLVWTPTGPDCNKLRKAVTIFKNILEQHANCKVLDYLDLLSLPQEYQQQLLCNPVTWVDYVLRQTNIKILLIASEGACQYQKQFKPINGFNGQSSTVYNTIEMENYNPLDRILFPYILRKLKDQPHLSSDYTRIFHIRFPSTSNAESELEGLVTWTRYLIPQHLNSLVLKIHGMSEGLTNTKLLSSLDSEPSLLSAFSDTCSDDIEYDNATDYLINACQNNKITINIPNDIKSNTPNGLSVKGVNSTGKNTVICFKCADQNEDKTSASDDIRCETVLDSALLNNDKCMCQITNEMNKSIDSKDENFKRKKTKYLQKYATVNNKSNNSIENSSSISTNETSDEESLDFLCIDVFK